MKTMTLALASLLAASAASAQAQTDDHDLANMPGMDHSKMDHGAMDPNMPGMKMSAGEDEGFQGQVVASLAPFSQGSGTARLPNERGSMHGLHIPAGDWMLMVHGYLTGTYTDHKGPRGDDLLYSTSMLMLSGERQTGWGRIQLYSMLSLEPTLSPRGYPNLFATGETASGQPLVDRQHPHDLFMELSARLDFDIGRGASLFLYGGPVGEPALGPSAFMHRGSARNNPEPPISHHWFDSTHITYGVVTTGMATPHWQIEGSVFRGAEPDEIDGTSRRRSSTAGRRASAGIRRRTGRLRSATASSRHRKPRILARMNIAPRPASIIQTAASRPWPPSPPRTDRRATH